MLKVFNLNNWYWIIGSDKTKVFSSNRSLLVDIADITYTNWVAQGNLPTTIDSQQSLNDVLNAPIIIQIAALEQSQLRPMRELALGDTTASVRLATINTQIAALRATLHK